MRRFLGLLTGLAVLLGAAPAFADLPPGPGVPLSALIGLDATAVRARLAPVAADWPIPRGFQVTTAEGVLTFVTVGELMTDPALAARMAAWRSQADYDQVPDAPYLACRTGLAAAGGTSTEAYGVVLVFRDGRLDRAFQRAEPPQEPIPSSADRKAWTAWVRRPRISPFQAQFGDLPLEDGAGFLSRWITQPLAPDDALAASCAPPPPPRYPPPQRRQSGLSASDMQGLALLPFAIGLPSMNAGRAAARRAGATELAALHVGDRLAEAPQAFAAHHAGMRAYSGRAKDYAVLSLDLGGYPSRNLSNFKDAALIGVRAGRIEWLSTPASLGPDPSVLCLDDHGVPNAPRRGCSGWGQFSP